MKIYIKKKIEQFIERKLSFYNVLLKKDENNKNNMLRDIQKLTEMLNELESLFYDALNQSLTIREQRMMVYFLSEIKNDIF